jgi:glycosyltransferase involved in cell wall biosynthesis
MNRKVAYITVKTPFSLDEAFILTELLAIFKQTSSLIVIPRDVWHKEFHEKAVPLHELTVCIPWLNVDIAWKVILYAVGHPLKFGQVIRRVLLSATSFQVALRNALILPKSIFLALTLDTEQIIHIHAHWSSTPSTIAYIISLITGIPWSFTAHRGDITSNNLLLEKCKQASFVRCIDENGRKDIIKIIGNNSPTSKIKVIHMGVEITPRIRHSSPANNQFTFLCPASFVPKKGHVYLIEACRILVNKGVDFRCLLVGGGGALEGEMKSLTISLRLTRHVIFKGKIPHEILFDLYESGKVDCVVLPSIATIDGACEGIPVALMEAMAYGIPCISTNTGGIAELLGGGSGSIIEEKSSSAIAGAVLKIMGDPDYARRLGEVGRKKVESDFNADIIARQLLELYYKAPSNQKS